MSGNTEWLTEHSDALRAMVDARSGSYSDYANRLNAEFKTAYTRNAAIGRAKRMGLCNPPQIGPSLHAIERARQRDKLKKRQMREKRWAANPSLRQRYENLGAKKALCNLMLRNGATKTSATYRKHLPHLPEMTKNELRAMLTGAVRNTAAMEAS